MYLSSGTSTRWPGIVKDQVSRCRPIKRPGKISIFCMAKGLGGLPVPDFKLKSDYKTKIAEYYDRISGRYDEGEWHPRIAKILIDGCKLKKGDKVLDLCAGTGISTLLAAEAVGKEGQVVAVDISMQMLEKLREKIEEEGWKDTVEVVVADAETVEFPSKRFDCVLCSSAFIWMSDLAAVLARWREFLVPGGFLAFHAFPEEAFVNGVMMIDAAAKHGVTLTMSQPTGTEERVENLLSIAGFSSVNVVRVEEGSWLSVEDAKKSFPSMASADNPMTTPMINVTKDQLAAIQEEYIREIDRRATSEGIWNDKSILYTYAQRE